MKTYPAKTLLSPRSLGLGIEGQMVGVPEKLLKEDVKVIFQGEYMVIRKGEYPVHTQTFKDKFKEDKFYTLHYFMFKGKPDVDGDQIDIQGAFANVDPKIMETDSWKALGRKLQVHK